MTKVSTLHHSLVESTVYVKVKTCCLSKHKHMLLDLPTNILQLLFCRLEFDNCSEFHR